MPDDTEAIAGTKMDSQGSIMAKIRIAKSEATNTKEYVCTSTVILCGSVIINAVVLAFALTLVTCIGTGALYLNDCSAQKFIPIFLIVWGVVGILSIILSATLALHGGGSFKSFFTWIVIIVGCFLIGWYIAGCVAVYGVYLPNFDDPHSTEYCAMGVYYLAFVEAILSFALAVVFILCCGCTMIAAARTK